MIAFRFIAPAIGLAALAYAQSAAPAEAVVRQETTVNGLKVWRFVWTDSKGQNRSLSLKKQGEGNPGNGGYAVQFVYKYKSGATLKQVIANAPNGDGFGYFVGHERERLFADNTEDTIAFKIGGGEDDSPLGLKFPVTTRGVATGPHKGIIQFKLNYPKWGSIAATGFDSNTGKDNPPLSTNKSLYKRYQLPVTITWYFQDGRDFPRIVTRVDMSPVPGANRVSFDLRGPYGKLDFDQGAHPIQQVLWGDRLQFKSTLATLSNQSTWVWNQVNPGGRYNSLFANGTYEIGLFEPVPFAKTATNDGYANGRGQTSAAYQCGGGVVLPCDPEWAYQSSQYELPANGDTTSEKIAWGSAPFYGMNIPSTFDGQVSFPFDGFPAGKYIQYQVCLVLGQLVSGGLTRTTSIRGGTYNCADTSLN